MSDASVSGLNDSFANPLFLACKQDLDDTVAIHPTSGEGMS